MENIIKNKNTKPVCILVRPQMGENIGMCARALLNMGGMDLRLVSPRDGWPNDKAISASAGAFDIIEAKVFENIADAISDLNYVFATSAKIRDLELETFDSKNLPQILIDTNHNKNNDFSNIGILFGSEASGLSNDELFHVDKLITIDTNSSFPSLNLAQAVGLIYYTVSFVDSFANTINMTDKNKITIDEQNNTSLEKSHITPLINNIEKIIQNNDLYGNSATQKSVIIRINNMIKRACKDNNDVNLIYGLISKLGKIKQK